MRKLEKASLDKSLFGVCGGLAAFAGISSFSVRLIFIITCPVSFFVYIILNNAMHEPNHLRGI
ncbi:PspC domain-containing protein [Paenibacillus daejeonensis]|uniref:PspC domain-containing protein n=1 Tax=Paenibacillus daejeonensis TaxID=135193 RepID=UPI000364506C|nr:PspC domain-containing protein [Paenibacillus daejeonensis]